MSARLHPDDLTALADAVAARLAPLLAPVDAGGSPRLLSASEAAQRLGRSRDWCYRHAEDLGAVRLGDGDRPRLGFPVDGLAAYVSRCVPGSGATEADAAPQAAPRRRRRRQTSGDSDRLSQFLPIRGER